MSIQRSTAMQVSFLLSFSFLLSLHFSLSPIHHFSSCRFLGCLRSRSTQDLFSRPRGTDIRSGIPSVSSLLFLLSFYSPLPSLFCSFRGRLTFGRRDPAYKLFEPVSPGDRLAFEVDLDSPKRSLRAFVKGKPLNFIINNIPSSIRFTVCYDLSLPILPHLL